MAVKCVGMAQFPPLITLNCNLGITARVLCQALSVMGRELLTDLRQSLNVLVLLLSMVTNRGTSCGYDPTLTYVMNI